MKVRTLLRDEKKQKLLEKNGAVVIPFLIPSNIDWLLDLKKTDHQNLRMHEILNEKIQSKVEYRCINCSPFYLYFNTLINVDKNRHPFLIQDSITDENQYASLHLIAPLIYESQKPFVFRYLARTHLLPSTPRGRGIPGIYDSHESLLSANFSFLKVKSGEAILFFSNVPYSFDPHESESVTVLEAAILPYEARTMVYELPQDIIGQKLLKRFKIDVQNLVDYRMTGNIGSSGATELRQILYSPYDLSEEDKLSLSQRRTFKSLLLDKLFRQ